MRASQTNRFPILIFFIPIFLGLLFTYYYRESRRALSERLVQSGVLALFENGMVTREDVRKYFQTPPTEENPILRALDITPEDVTGLEMEKQEWLNSSPGQRLISRIIKHIALIKYLIAQPDAEPVAGLDASIKNYREELMFSRMEEDLSKVTPTITQEEMMDYYIQNPEEFFQEGKRLARHIMLYDESTAPNTSDPFNTTPEQIRSSIENGEDFQKLLVKSRSDSANNDGLLGWLPKGVLAEAFEKELWSMEVGEIRGPIQISGSYHFIHLIDEQAEGLQPFEQCKDKIHRILEEEKRVLYRYKFLGLPEELAYSPDPQYTEEYRKALLKAAYAREWDKNMEIVKKTEAFSQYQQAEHSFRNQVDQLRQIRHLPRELETTWMMEVEAANMLLKKMKFRILIKLQTEIQDMPQLDENE